MALELISFQASDGYPLDGLYYRPDTADQNTPAVLVVHGKARNFYTGPSRFLPPFFVERGIACLAINRRGHDVVYARVGVHEQMGAAMETFADSQRDIDGAMSWLRNRGHEQIALAGHSFGGGATAYYISKHEVAAAVLLSPVGGGPGYVENASSKGWFAGEAYGQVVGEAKALAAAGKGDDLLVVPKWWWVISANSLLDLSQNVPLLEESARGFNCPVLAIRGSLEPVNSYPVEAAQAAAKPGLVQVSIVEGADHYYTGLEDKVGPQVAEWLGKHLLVTSH